MEEIVICVNIKGIVRDFVMAQGEWLTSENEEDVKRKVRNVLKAFKNMACDIKLKKCGYKVEPPSIVITYSIAYSGKTHRRTMPLRHFTKNSLVSLFAHEIKHNPRHEKYLESISISQMEKLVTMIKDQLNGLSLEAAISKNCDEEIIDPNEDLNKLDNDELNKKKAIMDKVFEASRIKPDDVNFEYDIQVDFADGAVESSGWDSEASDDGF